MSSLNPLPLIKSSNSKFLPHRCRICGAPAEYSHFGVISCASCKIFFRRNGNIGQNKFLCDFDGECEVNINTRHICTSCRLTKCFYSGMSTDLFRPSSKNKSSTKTLIKAKVQHQSPRLPVLNLLQSDQSLLSTNQWILLSNLCNGYNESQILSIGQRLIDINDVIQSPNINYQSLVQEFLTCNYETTGTYLRSNDDLCQLSSNDRSIMIHNAADNLSCMGWGFAMHHGHLLSLEAFSNIMKMMYGERAVDMQLRAMKFIDPDIVLVKLALSLFAFSENTVFYYPNISRDLTNSIIILEIQNKYAEVTWKYLLYRYGHHQAVKRFVNLISWLEACTIFMYHVQSLTLHVNDVNSLVEQTELTLILDDVDQMIEMNQ